MADQGEQGIDLEPYLSVLDREQLEHLVVFMIMKNPDNFDLLETAVEFIDHNALLTSLDPIEDTNSIDEIFPSISDVFTRYQSYMKLGLYYNALTVLYALSNQILLKIFEFGITPDDQSLLDLITKLEVEWKELATKYKPSDKPSTPNEKDKSQSLAAKPKPTKSKSSKSSSQGGDGDDEDDDLDDDDIFNSTIDVPHTLMDIFEKLASWRVKLDKLGPMFSDPLRVLKSRIKKEETPPSSSSDTVNASATDAKRRPPAAGAAGDDSVRPAIKKKRR